MELKACDKFLNNTPVEQWAHVLEEKTEVSIALAEYHTDPTPENLDRLAEEIVDLQTSCETLLAIVKVNSATVRRKVFWKNAKRGYFD